MQLDLCTVQYEGIYTVGGATATPSAPPLAHADFTVYQGSALSITHCTTLSITQRTLSNRLG